MTKEPGACSSLAKGITPVVDTVLNQAETVQKPLAGMLDDTNGQGGQGDEFGSAAVRH